MGGVKNPRELKIVEELLLPYLQLNSRPLALLTVHFSTKEQSIMVKGLYK